jgi:hypothetical protein
MYEEHYVYSQCNACLKNKQIWNLSCGMSFGTCKIMKYLDIKYKGAIRSKYMCGLQWREREFFGRVF